LLDKKSTNGLGHVGVIVGNEKSGYNYYSKIPMSGSKLDAISGAGPEGIVKQSDRSLNNLIEKINADRVTKYEVGLRIETTSQQDKLMTSYADSRVSDVNHFRGQNYSLISNNCTHLVQDIFKQGNLSLESSILPRSLFNSTEKTFDSNSTKFEIQSN
jgi:hypothetical protein